MGNPTPHSDFRCVARVRCPVWDHLFMLGGGRTITLFHVRGIRIAVDWSWFFVLFLVIFWLSQFYGDVLGESSSSSTPSALARITAVAFFGSIALPELGHAFVAIRNGI